MTAISLSTPAATARLAPVVASETVGQVQSLAKRIRAMLSTERAGGHAIGVTSCSRREGVSVVAGNLAACAPDVYPGRVLLVDANPRHASVASRFGVRRSPGLAEYLTGASAIHECIADSNLRNLCVLPAGSSLIRSTRYSDERTRALFENLRQDFELVVVDLPPANEMDELLLTSQLFDGFLLVLEAERIRREVARHVKRHFEQLDARILGVVLNKRQNHIPEWLYRRL